MKPATATPHVTPAAGRTIVEILLSRSLVTDEELDEALAIQRETGKPLGQILVEAGTITRLELASALAEQWGDAGTISPTFPGGSAYVDPNDHDGGPSAQLEELRRTRRALEERMLAFERTATDAEWQQEAATGLRALFSRVEVLEATLGHVSDADATMHAGELRDAVVELTRRVGGIAHELESLRDRVDGTASVAAMQYGLSGVEERVDEVLPKIEASEASIDAVADRVEEIASGLAAAIDELRRSMHASTAAHEGLASKLEASVGPETVQVLYAAVDEVRDQVAELAQRTSVDPDLGTRLDAIASDLAARPDGATVSALADAVAELGARPKSDPELAGRVEDMASRVEQLSERLDLGAGAAPGAAQPDSRVDALIARVAELAARPAGDPTLEARLVETNARVEAVAAELAERPIGDPGVEDLLGEIGRRLDAVAAELAERADAAEQAELAQLVAELAERPAFDPTLVERVSELAAQLEEVASRPTADPALASRLDELADRVELGMGQPAVSEEDPRVDALLAQVAELAAQVEDVGGVLGDEPVPAALEEQLAAAGAFSQGLSEELARAASAWVDGRRELEARVEWLAARLESVAAAPSYSPPTDGGSGEPGGAAVDADVERLRMAVERLMLDFAEHRRALSAAVPGRDLDERVRRLTEQVDGLTGLAAVSGGAGTGSGGTTAGSLDRELAGQVRGLITRLEEVEAGTAAGRETILARLERMMGTIDWRLQRLEKPESQS